MARFGAANSCWPKRIRFNEPPAFVNSGYLECELAVKEPRRTALGVLYEIWGHNGLQDRRLAPIAEFSEREIALIEKTLVKALNAPATSSAGRLFDAVASLVGLRQSASFEGQAAIELESIIDSEIADFYPFEIRDGLPQIIDWAPMVREILVDLRREKSAGFISAKCHNTLPEVIIEIARAIAQPKVVLTGGCFQNRYLLERSVLRLSQGGFRPYWHQRVPTNDGGIAFGQVVAAARVSRRMVSREGVAAQ
jgi:hydrogenase maturation protein HypF